jgi:predicted phage terminase large subunit-like protein
LSATARAPGEWRPNVGPQTRFLACAAFEALYGGQAGGGKSVAIVIDPLRFIAHPGFAAILFRRTDPELAMSGGLLQRTHEYYPAAGGQPRDGGRLWTFPSGARIQLSAMQYASDRFAYSGSEFSWIGFDELTTFEEAQYTFMVSRLRSTAGLPPRLRATTNPGGPGHAWVMARFAPWLYPEDKPERHAYRGVFAEPEERLFYRFDERLASEVWTSRDYFEPLCDACKGPGKACEDHRPLARVFFPASLADNPPLARTGYRRALDALDPLTRAQLKHGDWLALARPRLMFRREWFHVLEMSAPDVMFRCRYWDRASTSIAEEKAGKMQAATAGVRMAILEDRRVIVEDVVRLFGSPGEVEHVIAETAKGDAMLRGGCEQILEQDPGQAGVVEVDHLIEALSHVHDDNGNAIAVRGVRPLGDKIARARPLSAAAEGRRVAIVRGPWNAAYLDELELFPTGRKDQVDASSGAYNACTRAVGKPPPGGTGTSPDRTPTMHRGLGGY